MKNILGIAAAVLVTSVAGTVHAQSQNMTPWYAGGALGATKSNVNAGEVNAYLLSVGFGSPSTSADNKDTAYRFLLGYQFSPAVAVEGFYADMGKYNTRSNVTNPSVGTINADYKAKGYGIDLVLSAPFTPEFSVFGRVGVIRAKTEATFNSSGSVGLLFNRGSKSKTGQHYGVGLQYDINPALALRGEVETYRKLGDDTTGGELKADALSIGAIFRF